MSAISAGLEIVNKVMSLFQWDRKAIRRAKLAKLKKKELELISKPWSVSLGADLARVRMQISELQEAAANDN